MTFGHHGRPANIALTINQKNLKQVSEYKYLGIVLCPLLGWDSHISLISAKVKWRIGAYHHPFNTVNNASFLLSPLVCPDGIAALRPATR